MHAILFPLDPLDERTPYTLAHDGDAWVLTSDDTEPGTPVAEAVVVEVSVTTTHLVPGLQTVLTVVE